MGDPGLDIKYELQMLGTAEKVDAEGINRSNFCETSFGSLGGFLLKCQVWSWMQQFKMM